MVYFHKGSQIAQVELRQETHASHFPTSQAWKQLLVEGQNSSMQPRHFAAGKFTFLPLDEANIAARISVKATMKSFIAFFALVCFVVVVSDFTDASPIQDSAESKDICCFGCVNCKTELNENKDICCDVCYICKDHEGVHQSDGSKMFLARISAQ
ncbi:unnamed protein product [Notodromas monacha]|uniref:Uncharacterized protein n=1 Tax=Notodromas monacha TaxID=399045 RepID=A0A7R9BUU7_9CRUS|nr:unnamed protein product [Notodromas monacha]CAG0922165.1 unnamed protein product [Notodromas monacha]